MDPQGFTWDLGGHVVFSHYGEFDKILEEEMGDDVYHHERSSYIRFDDRWVPYPFQNNLRHLPPEVAHECLIGLIEAPGGDPAYRLPDVDAGGVRRGHHQTLHGAVQLQGLGDAGRGDGRAVDRRASRASSTTRTPLRTIIFEARRCRVGAEQHVHVPGLRRDRRDLPASGRCDSATARSFGRELVEVDAARQDRIRSRTEADEDYDALVSTMPLDLLVQTIKDCPERLREAAEDLEHNGVYMVGIGYETPLKDDKSWMYFPQDHAPFYRATNFAKYSPANVPDADTARYCAYMTEISNSRHKPEAREGLEERVEEGLRASGVVAGRPEVASMHTEYIEYAYPVPDTEDETRHSAHDPTVAAGARHLLARPFRFVEVRDREHGPRREDGHRRRPPARGGHSRGGLVGLNQKDPAVPLRSPLFAAMHGRLRRQWQGVRRRLADVRLRPTSESPVAIETAPEPKGDWFEAACATASEAARDHRPRLLRGPLARDHRSSRRHRTSSEASRPTATRARGTTCSASRSSSTGPATSRRRERSTRTAR